MNQVTLLEKINCGYAAFQTLLAVLGEAQMTTAGVNGSWSIKDVLTHLTAWQRAMVDRLHAAVRSEKPALTDLTDEEIDRLNEQFYQEGKSRPLAEVQTDFRTTFLQIVEVVQALPWEDLADAHRFAWLNRSEEHTSELQS